MGEVRTESGTFVNDRQHVLITKLYQPPQGTPLKGVLVRCHGLGDYTERSDEGSELFASLGYAVYAFDMHGHGGSAPHEEHERFAVYRFSHLVADAEKFILDVVEPWRRALPLPVPLFVSGTSMGGLVVLHAVTRGNVPPPSGVLLTAPALGIVKTPVMRLQEPIAGLLNILAPRARLVPALDPERLIVDPAQVEKVKQDERLNKGNVRVCTACSVLEGIEQLSSLTHKLAAPVLMIHGENDVTCSPDVARQALEEMASEDKTWVLIREAKHDLEEDFWKKEWQDAMVHWLQTRTETWRPEREVATAAS